MADVTDRWTQVQTLFEDALDRPADERTAWLRAACGDDPDLYREVEALLDGDAHQNALLDGRVSDLLGEAHLGDALVPSRLGERVGPWRIEARIGEGGMGAVYRAERVDGAYEQTAALKLVKPGMDSEAVLARFRSERQILARLQHAGIARLLDGGLTEAERPYFAMEYVDGEPITAYCDARRLGVDARLRLFVRVCEAVRYAHRALVVHRDLKPSNVLV
ncbi:MAG: protein kinase, partial [Bacteroidota bacterium]